VFTARYELSTSHQSMWDLWWTKRNIGKFCPASNIQPMSHAHASIMAPDSVQAKDPTDTTVESAKLGSRRYTEYLTVSQQADRLTQ
jgi:hypothetical protein